MADRSQNILIKYEFDTASVERATATLNRANQASNQLQNNAQKAGQTTSQAFSGATRSILSMEIELQRLKTQIQVSTDPQRINQLSTQYKKLAEDIKKANQQAFGGAKPAIDQTNSALGSLVKTAGSLITVGLAKEAVSIALGMAELAGNVEGVERAFSNRFPNSIKLLEDLRAATHGTVTDFELMQRSLQATNLGVAVEELPKLLEFAAARAQQTGQSVDYLVESIVNGIGRKSPLILDNLGISATRLKEKFDGAALASQSVGDVTRAVGEIIQEEMQKSGGYIETSATKVKQMNVAFQDLYVTLSKKLATSWLADLGTMTAKGLNDLVKIISSGGFKQIDKEFLEAQAAHIAASIKEGEAYKKLGDDRQAQFDLLQQEINSRQQNIGRLNDNIDALTKERDIIRDKHPYDERIDSINKTIKGYNQSIFVIQETMKILAKYRNEIELTNQTEQGPSTGIIERKKKDIEDLRKEIEKTNNVSDLTRIVVDKDGNATMQAGRLIQKLEILQAELADLQRSFYDIDIKPLEIKLKNASDGLKASIEDPIKQIDLTVPAQTVAQLDTFFDDLKGAFHDNLLEITAMSIDIFHDLASNMVDANTGALEQQLSDTDAFYKKQLQAAGDNANARTTIERNQALATSAIRNEIARREKRAKRSQVIIDTAAGIVKALATVAWPYSLIVGGLIAASGAVQLNKINSQPDKFAKGGINIKGPGTTTSDSIPAMLSRGESVMTAEETYRARNVLEQVRARKLDDNVLKQLNLSRYAGNTSVQATSLDDSRIVKAIKDNRPADLVQQGSILFEQRQHGENLKRKVRSKSINL